MKFLFGLLLIFCCPFLSNGQCPVINAAMINACATFPSTSEGINEYVFFSTTSAATAGSYTLTYGTSNPPTSSPSPNILAGSNARPKNGTGTLTSTNGCIINLVTSPATVIPANSSVILLPSNFDADYDLTAVCGSGSLYVILVDINAAPSDSWGPGGTFANSSGSSPRYLEISNGANGCTSNITSYNGNGWASSADGNSVWWTASGSPTYQNTGCSTVIPPKPTITPAAIAAVCEGTSTASMPFTTTYNPNKYSIDWNNAANTAGFVDIAAATLPASPLTLSIPAGAAAGTYTGSLTVINSATPDTSIAQNISVTINAKPIITVHPADTVVNVCQNGTISPLSVSATAGSGSISGYQWYINSFNNNTTGFAFPSATNSSFLPSTANIGTLYFYCKVTNSNGCSNTSNVSGALVVSAPVATPTILPPTQPTCTTTTGSITITAPVGPNIQYSNDGITYQPALTFSNLAPGNHNITAKNVVTGCVSAIKLVTINPVPAVPAVPGASVTTQPSCSTTTGTITVSSPLGANYEYSVGGVYQPQLIFSGLTNNTVYNVTVKDLTTGCISNALPLTVNAIPAAPAAPGIDPVTQPDCNTPTGSVTITSPIGINYEYSNGGTYQGIASFAGLLPGTNYALTVKDISTGCISAATNISINVIAPVAAPTVISPVTYCQNATASALSATGSNIKWYATLTGVVALPGTPIPSTSTAGTVKYYVSQTIGSCESARDSITVVVNPSPAIPVVASNAIAYCQNATATVLSATGTNLQWYATLTSVPALPAAPTPATTATGSTTYYVSQTVSGCESPRNSITVTVNAIPNAPAVANNNISYCQNTTAAVLSATGTNLQWYATLTSMPALPAAPTPVTTATGSTTYYVSQTVNGCESPRADITVTINPIPAMPAVANNNIAYCQNTAAAVLSATGTNLQWYATLTSVPALPAAPTPVTTIAGSISYYVSQTVNGCESPRNFITVTIDPAPAAPTVASNTIVYCQNATATVLSATGTNLRWYATLTSVPALPGAPTPVTTATGSTTYYVSQTINGCESPRTAITVTVNPTPAAPTVANNNIAYCQNTTATALSATGSNLQWYANLIGGPVLPGTPTPVTTATGATTYYVSQTMSGCESPRTAITVTVNPTPAAPTVAINTFVYCQNVTAAVLSATGINLQWYATQTSVPALPGAPTPVTTSAGSTTYYVSQTVNGCESPRTAITVTVNPTPVAPTVASSNIVYCQNAAATALSATGSNLQWYTTLTSVPALPGAPTPVTTAAGSTTYYVSQTINGCESPRTAITVTVNPTPTMPVVTNNNLSSCFNGTAPALSATGTNLQWYTVASGGTALPGTPAVSTGSAGTNVYYVSQTINGCESPRNSISVLVYALTQPPVVISPVTWCQNQVATPLTATGNNLQWYSASTGNTLLPGAPTPLTTAPGNTFYYVSQTLNGCESQRRAITVTVNVTSTAVTGFKYTPDTICLNGSNPSPAYDLGFTSGGTFTSTPAGLGINAATGDVDLSASTVGTYTITYTYNTTGCVNGNSSSFNITTIPSVNTVTLFSYSSPICKNAANVLPQTAPGFTTGGVFSSSSGLSINGSTGEIDIANSAPGFYQVAYILSTLGCRQGRTTFANITIADTASPVTSFNYSSTDVCISTGINPTLIKPANFSAGGTFSATPAGLNINAATGAVNIGLSVPGVYKIAYTIPALACQLPGRDSIKFILRSYGNPVTNFSYFSPVCKGDDTATAVTDIAFTPGGAFSATPAGLSINTVTGTINLQQSLPGIYDVRYDVALGVCNPAGFGSTQIQILGQPESPAVTPVGICGPGTISLSATALGTVSWYTDAALLNQVNVGNTFITSVSSTTAYYVTNTIGTCESEPALVNAVVSPIPAKPFLGSDTSICSNDRLVLDAGSYNNYLWQDGSTGRTFTVANLNPGINTYKVIVSTGVGCADSTSIAITLLDNCDDILYPNAFSPDGHNKTFGALGNLFIVSNYVLTIFNRYGETVFVTTDPYKKWDGSFKGKPVNAGAYIYVATYLYKNKVTKVKKGSILLIR